tara:strand:- start:468 stop:1439 length:972 start_codon:yes stop_codon:yes gene_type:complete
MKNLDNLDKYQIKKIYKINFSKINVEFLKFQSFFLSDIYRRYNFDLDNANIILFFILESHKQILRERDFDLNLDISLENFWKNYSKLHQKKIKISEISSALGIPKETIRRKIEVLIKLKILKKNSKTIYWSPSDQDKNYFDKIVEKNIQEITKIFKIITIHNKSKISSIEIKNTCLKYFSFYTFHFLNVQIKYLKLMYDQLKDLELLLIMIECSIETYKFKKIQTYSFEEIYSLRKEINTHDTPSVSADSMSRTTGIPRSTCIRKLKKLFKLKIIDKDLITKKYYFNNKNFISNPLQTLSINEKVIDMFGNFYFIILKILRKN